MITIAAPPTWTNADVGGANIEGCDLTGLRGTPLNAATATWRGARCLDGVLQPTTGSPTCAGHFVAR